MIIAEIDPPAEPSISKRIAQRVDVEKNAFEVVLARNRRVRRQSGRRSDGRSRRARLLEPSDEEEDDEDDSKNDVSALFRTDPEDVAVTKERRSAMVQMNSEDKMALLHETPVERTEPHRLWLGHIPDEAAEKGKSYLEGRLRKLCQMYGEITGVVAHPRFDDIESSRMNNQSWGIVTFKPGTMDEFKDILARKVIMGENPPHFPSIFSADFFESLLQKWLQK